MRSLIVLLIILALLGVPQIVWQGFVKHTSTGIIFYNKARRLISRVCKSSLAYVRDVSVESLFLDSIPVVYEYPDVFQIDLPDLSSLCDIKFIIYLETGTRPISMAPYCMALIELNS